jgi:hypothetical protein
MDACNVGDEGGFALNILENREALELIKTAIAKAGATEIVKIGMGRCRQLPVVFEPPWVLSSFAVMTLISRTLHLRPNPKSRALHLPTCIALSSPTTP